MRKIKKIIGLMLVFLGVISLSSCSLIDNLIVRTSSITTTDTPTTTSLTPSSSTNKKTSTTSTRSNVDGYIVTFECNNGTKYNEVFTNKITKPSDPVKANASFLYWSSDEKLTTEYNFSTKLTSDMTLYAKYSIDYKSLTNDLSTSKIKANVQINHTNQRSVFSSSSKSIGSGTIFYSDTSYYYILTCHHVIYPENGNIEYSTYSVYDCYDQEYKDAKLLYRDVNYDLAILRINKLTSTTKIPEVITLGNDCYLNEEVIAIGEPHGQTNTITYGTFINWYNFSPDLETINESNVNFEVIAHDAHIDSGSSGGALLDTNFNLIGVNFASGTSSKGTYSYAIPIYKIKDFLANADDELGLNL